ncbi:MAG: hypothetical protein J1E97_01025 [Muribaculaceae bacterium]|nr:hypothetical protein [Muribaculaceae bacterium]
MLNQEIIKKIEEKFGKKLQYSHDCEALSEAIAETVGERISVATLKRMAGMVSKKCQPRLSTMDIIAQYIGYPNYQLLAQDIDDDTEISEFAWVEELESKSLKEGTQLQITYDPGRVLVLTYLGNDTFIVNESYKSKLQQGDVVTISHFTKGFELLVADVVRNGESIGSYQAAKAGGLTSIELFLTD